MSVLNLGLNHILLHLSCLVMNHKRFLTQGREIKRNVSLGRERRLPLIRRRKGVPNQKDEMSGQILPEINAGPLKLPLPVCVCPNLSEEIHRSLWRPAKVCLCATQRFGTPLSALSPLVQLTVSTYLPSPRDPINTERLPLLGCETRPSLK